MDGVEYGRRGAMRVSRRRCGAGDRWPAGASRAVRSLLTARTQTTKMGTGRACKSREAEMKAQKHQVERTGLDGCEVVRSDTQMVSCIMDDG